MALRESESPVAKLAGDAVFELNNPNMMAKAIAAGLTAEE